MDNVPEVTKGNPENPNPDEALVKGCERLFIRYADFTETTGEKGFYPPGEYTDSYRSLGLEHFPPSGLGMTPAYDAPIKEGQPPYLDTRFPFTILQRRDIHPDLEDLPNMKVVLPIDSRCHFGYGRVEFYTYEHGQWRAVTYDRRPALNALKAQISSGETVDVMNAITDLMNGMRDTEENAELEESMGVAREVSADELKALIDLVKDPQVIRNDKIGKHFKGIFADSRELRDKIEEEEIRLNSNPVNEKSIERIDRHQDTGKKNREL